jgi:hypothetical protein
MALREAIFFFIARGQQNTVSHKPSQLTACGTDRLKEKDRLTRARFGAGERVERK